MYNIAVVGDRESVLGFRALGLSVFPTDTPERARETIHRLAQEDYAVIYLTEQLGAQLGAQLGDLLAQYQTQLTPAILLIPGKEGSLGIGMEKITSTVERAVGADILAGS